MASFQEESGLFDILQPLIRRWQVILIGVVLGTIAATVFTFLAKKTYQTSALLQVGAILDKQIEESYTVVDIINSDSFHQVVGSRLKLPQSPKQLTKMIRAETNMVRPSPIITVTVESDSPEGTVQLAKAVADVMIERHRPMFDDKLEYYNKWTSQMEGQIDQYEQEVKTMAADLKKLEQANRAYDLPTILLVETKLSDKESQLVNWRRELREMLAFRTLVHTHDTALVAPPVLPNKPSSPRLLLNVAVGFCVSLFLMISLVLLSDQYRKASLRI